MIQKIRSLIRKDERGNAELPVALIMLPFAVFLIFALIDVTFYMQTRSSVQSVLRDGTRTVALFGGNSKSSPLNTTGKNVSDIIKAQLWDGSRCLRSNCTAAPVVSCTPSLATQVAQQVSCTVTYKYKPVANDFFFGFSSWTSAPYTLTETSLSETRF